MDFKYRYFGHVCFYCNHYEDTLDFYENGLGFSRACDLKDKEGILRLTYVKIGEGQYIELFPKGYASDNNKTDRAFCGMTMLVGEIGNMTERLKQRGYWYEEAGLMLGDIHTKDPEGNDIWIRSNGITTEHAELSKGILQCADIKSLSYFYREVLEVGAYVEFTGDRKCDGNRRDSYRHMCFVVEDILQAAHELEARGISIKTGTAKCINPYVYRPDPDKAGTFMIYDPEGNEIEFMQYKENQEEM